MAQAVPGQERRANDYLSERLRLTTILPIFLIPSLVKNTRGRAPRTRVRGFRELLAFPGYIFIQLAKDDHWVPIDQVPGLVRLIRERGPVDSEQAPTLARVPTPYMNRMIKIMSESDGYLPPPVTPGRFKSGQWVRMNDESHSFYGLIGLYEGQSEHERARVLFNMMGRKVSIVMSERDLIAA